MTSIINVNVMENVSQLRYVLGIAFLVMAFCALALGADPLLVGWFAAIGTADVLRHKAKSFIVKYGVPFVLYLIAILVAWSMPIGVFIISFIFMPLLVIELVFVIVESLVDGEVSE